MQKLMIALPTAAEVAGATRVVTADGTVPGTVAAVASVWVDDVSHVPAGEVYVVDERVRWEDDPAPAIVQVSFVHRAAGLDHDGFARHWGEVHTPLARSHHPHLRRYVQNVVTDCLGGARPVDGIAELGFDSHHDRQHRMYDSPEGAEVIRADVARFLDVAAGWRVVGPESFFVAPPTAEVRGATKNGGGERS